MYKKQWRLQRHVFKPEASGSHPAAFYGALSAFFSALPAMGCFMPGTFFATGGAKVSA